MNFSIAPFSDRAKAELLLVPFWEGESEWKGLPISSVVALGDFKGKQGETALLYPDGSKEPRLLLVGLGKEEKGTAESIRRAYAAAIRTAQAKRVRSVNLALPVCKNLPHDELLDAVADGVFLTTYSFRELKGEGSKENPSVPIDHLTFLDLKKSELSTLQKRKEIAAGVFFVRDLVNRNADDKSPPKLSAMALEMGREYPTIQTTLFDRKKLEEEKMGLILAVNRGAAQEPGLVLSSYFGDSSSKDHVVLVGKGVTFDTGGLNLKTGDGMLTMKCDMSGAATVLGTVRTAAALNLKVNVTAVAPLAENCIDAKSYKPGDVYRAYNGKTVEITNTDAEGRLILADALSYAVKHLKPTCMIDLASLTGAIVISLGEEMAGLFTDFDDLSKQLLDSSERTGELLWRMPLYADYRESLKSDVADLINSTGREAGSVKAALFLQEFTGQIPWAHIDFAGPCYKSKATHYQTTKATGFGVRLLIDFLTRRAGS